MNHPERGKGQFEQPQEEQPVPGRSSLGEVREEALASQAIKDRYQAAEEMFLARVEQLQQAEELMRPSEITSEEEQDDHFDQLARVYKQTCLEMGLPWPPLLLDDEESIQVDV